MKKETLIISVLVIFKLVLHIFLVHPSYDLHRDEYLHLDQAKHLAWGFESVPPFTSWISVLVRLLGNTVFWVKFFPAFFGALTMIIVWKIIATLNGGLFARILGTVAILFSVILRINILYQPNSFDILCWTVLYFLFLKYIQSPQKKWLLLAASCFAVGFLNKYNIVFLLLGLLPAILISYHRVLFLNRYLYWSALLAILIMAPNLVWQYQHNFPVVHHMRTLAETQLVNVDRTGFLKEQLLFFFGSLFIILASFIAFMVYHPFKQYRLFLWAFIFSLVIFIYFRAKSYYAIGLYPVLLAFGSVYLEHLTVKGWKRYLRPVMISVIIFTFVPILKIVFPVLPPQSILKNGEQMKELGLLRWEDGKDHALPQDFADMRGWRELARKVDSIWVDLGDPHHSIVLCDNYGQAGAINYYSTNKQMQAVSMNADYINWFPLNSMEIKNVILVKDNTDTDSARIREKRFFSLVTKEAAIEDPFARERGTIIYLLKDATTSINRVLKGEIQRRKADD